MGYRFVEAAISNEFPDLSRVVLKWDIWHGTLSSRRAPLSHRQAGGDSCTVAWFTGTGSTAPPRRLLCPDLGELSTDSRSLHPHRRALLPSPAGPYSAMTTSSLAHTSLVAGDQDPWRFTGTGLPLAAEGRLEILTEKRLGKPCPARGKRSAEFLRYSLCFYLFSPRSQRLAEYSLGASSFHSWKWGREALATAERTPANTRARIAMGHGYGMQSVDRKEPGTPLGDPWPSLHKEEKGVCPL